MRIAATLFPLFLSTLVQTQAQNLPQSLQFSPGTLQPTAWNMYYGSATVFESIVANAPDGTSVMQTTASAPGGILVQQQFPEALDVTRYDNFNFFIAASTSRIGDFVYLVDANHRRRWFPLILRSQDGWRQPVYSVNKYTNQDSGFDATHVTAVRFGQSGQMPGDNIWIGQIAFTDDMPINSYSWYQDVGSAQFELVTDSIAGQNALEAILVANAPSAPRQVDIASNGLISGIHWDWSNKKYVIFTFKNVLPEGAHQYFYWGTVCSLTEPIANSAACSCTATTCSINGAAAGYCDSTTCRSYREYIFDSPSSLSGQWENVSASLQDASANTVGEPALDDVNWFEVGIFDGPANAQYSFEIGPVTVH